jgi:hypothetical protein
MTMTRIEELWESLRSDAAGSQGDAGGWQLVRTDMEHPFDIYAGIDDGGAAVFAISTGVRPPATDADTQALTCFTLPRAGGRFLMGLRLASTALESVFGRLCQDLADAAADVGSEAALLSLFCARLQLWKRLFRDGSLGLLKKHAIRELVAELLALGEYIHADRKNPSGPVSCWKNPGACQDFVFPDRAVEVTSVAPGADTVGIASALQLDATLPLVLRVCALRECAATDPGALTLPLLVARTAEMLGAVPDARTALHDRLLAAGYVKHDHYHGIAFVPTETRHYAVGDGFPRLVRATLPPGIPDASYTILLASIAAFHIPEQRHAA